MASNDNNSNSAQVLLQKIEAIAKINTEIVERVRSFKEVTASVTYVVVPFFQQKGYKFEIQEVKENKQISQIISEHQPTIQLEQFPDIFNEKINYNCTSFQDLVRLNEELLKVAQKFAMFGENDMSRRALSTFLKNFELLQTGLGHIDEKTIEPKSRLPDLNKEIEKLQQVLNSLASDPQVEFKPPGLVCAEHFTLLHEWSGKTGWKLLYKASRDGFQPNQFHSKCDNKGATLTMIQSTQGYLFGGYSPQPWNSSSGYVNDTTNTAFLFSLINPGNRPPTKYKLTRPTHSIYCHASYGPTFGGHDIFTQPDGQSNSNCSFPHFPHSYEDTTGQGNNTFTGSKNFTIKDIEVYGL